MAVIAAYSKIIYKEKYMNSSEQFITLDNSHLSQITGIYKAAFSGEPWHDDWSDEKQLFLYIQDLACGFNSLNYGLFIDEKLTAVSIGSIHHWWSGTVYCIEEFCVLPEMQGRNIGSRFMAMIENDIRSRGIYNIFLQTDIEMPSYRFYKNNGFEDLTGHVSLHKKLDE